MTETIGALDRQLDEAPDRHLIWDKQIRADIKDGKHVYEQKGQEADLRIARAMAYAAKPYIDSVLRHLNDTPNQLGVKISNGRVEVAAPGTMDAYGNVTPYYDLDKTVEEAHRAANAKQAEYYGKLAQADELEEQARMLRQEALASL